MNYDQIKPSGSMIKVANAFTIISDDQICQMTRGLIRSEIQSKRKNLVLPQWSRPLLSGYFSLLEKLISLSCLPKIWNKWKWQTINLSYSNSRSKWNTDKWKWDWPFSFALCHLFLEVSFIQRRYPPLHEFWLAITNNNHKPSTRSHSSRLWNQIKYT